MHQPERGERVSYVSTSGSRRARLCIAFAPDIGSAAKKNVTKSVKTAVGGLALLLCNEHPPSPDKQPERPFAATFGDGIALEGFDLHDGQITLYWRSHSTPTKNYTVFVHALDAQGKPMSQSDATLAYPTALWDAGEQIIDTHLLTGLSDAASIQVGLYDPTTGARLSANHPDGAPWPDNAVQIK